jgi:hypothetical protein
MHPDAIVAVLAHAAGRSGSRILGVWRCVLVAAAGFCIL